MPPAAAGVRLQPQVRHPDSQQKGEVDQAAARPGPRPFYDGPILAHLKALWLATDEMCSRKLAAAIRLWMPYYESAGADGGLEPEVRAKLLTLSPATRPGQPTAGGT
jgi:hypothetical protein